MKMGFYQTIKTKMKKLAKIKYIKEMIRLIKKVNIIKKKRI